MSNRERMKYLNGFAFWVKNPFWRDPKRKFSERTVRYYESWLEGLRINERQLTRLQ